MADTSDATVSVVAEVTAGTTPANPAFKNLRITSESFTPTYENLVSNEIRADATVADVRRTGITTPGEIGFELHKDAMLDDLLAASIRGTWAANTTKGALLKPTFTMERKIIGAAATNYFRFTGTRFTGLTLSFTPDEMITGTLRGTGVGHTVGNAIIAGAAYTAASANVPMAGVDVTSLALSTVTGVDYTGLTIEIDNSTRVQRKLGQLAARGIGYGRRIITGTLTLFFENLDAYNALLANATHSIIATASDGVNSFTITLGRIRFTGGEVPVTGNDADFILTLNWQATYDPVTLTDIQIVRAP